MQLPVGEQAHAREKGAARVFERIREEESKDEAAEDGESAHKGEQPKPSRLSSDATHVQDSICQELGRCLTKLVAKVEDHDTFCRFLSGVPRREGPQSTRNKTGLGHTQEEARGDENAITFLERLEGADRAEEEELKREPFARADPVEDHVGRDLEQHDPQREHLLADVELVLGDADIFHEVVRDGVGNVPSVEL